MIQTLRRQRFAALWALFFALLCFQVHVAARAENDATASAMDLVILIDDSNSMYDRTTDSGFKKGSDPDQYRREAAAIMLNMCEVRTSRAAVLSFGDEPRDLAPEGQSYDGGLISISGDSLDNRKQLIREINAHEFQHVNTDVGQAINRAVELFARSGTVEGNQRVILLISDGRPYVPEGDPYQTGGDEAVAAVKNNPLFSPDNPDRIRLYMVALNVNGVNPDDLKAYRTMEACSDGCLYEADDASDLPDRFTDILARQIGSRLLGNNLNAYDLGDGRSGIRIRIPNRSVSEVNLLINTKDVNAKSVRLYKPPAAGQTQGDEAVEDGRSLFYNRTKNFVQYKIVSPDSFGNWVLSYAGTGAGNPASSLTVVFSYDLNLAAELSVPLRHNDLTKVNKGDTLKLKAWFKDGEDQRSGDSMLYQPVTKDEQGNEQGIRVLACALPADQSAPGDAYPAGAVELTATTEDGGAFVLNCKLQDLGITDAGEYRLYLRADGDGLLRDLPEAIPFTVINHPPVFKDHLSLTAVVNDPALEGMGKTASLPVSLSGPDAVGFDEDGALDTLRLEAESLNPEWFRVTDDNDQDDSVTVIAGAAGTGTLVLTASDGETDGTVIANVPLTIVDRCAQLTQRYKPTLTVNTSAGEDGHYPIGTQIGLTLRVTDAQPNADHLLEGYALAPTLTLDWSDGTSQNVPCARVPDTLSWTAAFDSGLTSRDATLDAVVLTGLEENGFRLRMDKPLKLIVGNKPPVVCMDVINGLRDTLWIEPAPLFSAPVDQTFNVDLSACFADDDPPEKMTYFAVALPAGAGVPATLSEARLAAAADETALSVTSGDRGAITLIPGKTGVYTLAFGATDPQKQSAYVTRSVTVRSRWDEQWRQIGLIAAAFVTVCALGAAVWVMLKPNCRGLVFELLRNGSTQTTAALPNTKWKRSMSAFKPDLDGVDEGLNRALSGVEIWPGRNRSLLLRVKTKLPNGVTASLNGTPLTRGKKNRWVLGNLFTLQTRQNGTDVTYGWRLKQGSPVPHHNGPVRPAVRKTNPKPF